MSHLGERLTALIDGELDNDARERALAHLTVCGECRVEADAQRRVKGRLAGAAPPAPSAELIDRLRSMAEPGEPLPPVPRALPGTPRARPHAATFDNRPYARSVAVAYQGVRPRRLRYALAGALSLIVIALTTAFALGGERDTSQVRVAPPVGRYAVEHAATAGEVPLTDPAAGAALTVVSTSTHP